ncbi:MAG: 4-hydroxy-tetrahydrodipicolinate synthase [Candidatus Altiarchaeota archaeon]|nr:4-hydroxy-tetrahydrodipicolinate synthase [Candidatus Altiarchaeota archaeon]
MNQKYSGAWTALVTPFTKEYGIDWVSLEKNISFQIKQGITGVLPMGTTGESATVTHEEHSNIISKTVEYVGGKSHVLAGTGSNSTDEALYETKLAVESGVDACLLVDCYYNKPSSLELRREYYSPILGAFPDTDFIAYAIPGRSVTVISAEDLSIIRSQYPNLVAVKEATGDFDRMRRTRELLDNEFNILSGDDPNTYKMMTDEGIMSSGVVSVLSNLTPHAIGQQVRLTLDGKIDEAAELDEALSPLSGLIGVTTDETVTLPNGVQATVKYKFPNPVPIKTMMAGCGMIDARLKRPMGKLTKKGVSTVRGALQKVWSQTPKILEPIEDFYDVDLAKRLEDDRIWDSLSY